MTAIRIVTAPCRLPSGTGKAFVDRMLRELSNKGRATALPIITKPTPTIEEPDKQEAKPNAHRPRHVRGGAASLHDASDRPDGLVTTRKWPPHPGQRYVGPWPPKWSSHRGYGRPKWELLPLTPEQQAWELDQMAKDQAREEAAKPAKK
jgi:hypothetical protein